MQSLNWYVQRLRSMTAREMLQRARAAARDRLDYLLLSSRQRPRELSELLLNGNDGPGFTIPALAEHRVGEPLPNQAWQEDLIGRAEAIAAHKLSFFDLEDCHLGESIDWNRDYGSGMAAPLIFAPAIDYRDFGVTGDCKYVWELSRHHHLVVLGRAYRITGDKKYAQEAAGQLESWMKQCPYGVGMHWRSGLELAIRLINWVWMLELIKPSGVVDGGAVSQIAGLRGQALVGDRPQVLLRLLR